jgi:benzoylformate decarboxylase
MATTQPKAYRWIRDYVFDALHDLGIRYIFGVPGTNEIPVIDGCDVPSNEVEYVQCLHENIAMGAAMGYARMTAKPGVVVLHVTPGTGHSIGNLSNAWKSRVPLVILCGQQHNQLVTQEPLLASNVVEIAQQFTKWAHEARSWQEVPLVLQRAFKEALAPPAGPVFVSLPWDFLVHEVEPGYDEALQVTRIPSRFSADPAAVQAGADVLRSAGAPVIVVGDAVGYAEAWSEVQQTAELLGAPVYLEGQSSMANFPNSDYHWQGELPGTQLAIRDRLHLHDVAFLCGFGSQAQITVFKYSDGPLIPHKLKQVYLANNTWDIGKNDYGEVGILGDIKATLPALNQLLGPKPSPKAAAGNAELQRLAKERDRQWAAYLAASEKVSPIRAVVVADALREVVQANKLERKYVYVHEAVSDSAPFQLLLPYAVPKSYYCVEGGSLGWSMPGALGIKSAHDCPQGIEAELVVNAVGNGSALFYPQVWWTGEHRSLPILYIIMNNLEYRTLIQGLATVVAAYGNAEGYEWKPVTSDPTYLQIKGPDFNFVELAKSFGVHHGERVSDPAKVKAAVAAGVAHVRTKKTAYVLEIFTDRAVTPDGPPPALAAGKKFLAARDIGETAPPLNQPPLDVFYHSAEDKAGQE